LTDNFRLVSHSLLPKASFYAWFSRSPCSAKILGVVANFKYSPENATSLWQKVVWQKILPHGGRPHNGVPQGTMPQGCGKK